MASVTGSRLAFFAPGLSGDDVNVILTPTGSPTVPAALAGKFNIEVFTVAASTLAGGYQASAFIQGALQLTNNLIQAGALNSTEQLLAGNYTVIDQFGRQSIQIVGNPAGGGASSTTVVGSAGDTITGSSNAANSQLIDASGINPSAVKGPMTVIGGAGNTTVWAAASDSIVGGKGAITVSGNAASFMTIIGGAGNLTAFDFGTKNVITGSTSGFSFIDDNYGGGGNTITGGAGNGPVTTPLGTTVAAGTYILGGIGDLITGGSGTMLVNALKGGMTVNGGAGAATVWGAPGVSIAGGTGALQAGGDNLSVAGGTGDLLVIGGVGDKVAGGGGSATVNAGANNTVTGGAGSVQFNAGSASTMTGGSGALLAFNLGKGNSIVGSTGAGSATFIDDSYQNPTLPGAFVGGANTLVGGAGATTVIAGPGDAIVGGAGVLQLILRSDLTGSETVNLSAGPGADVLKDQSVAGGLGTNVTVTGFSTPQDKIESAQSVASGTFLGTSSVLGGNTILTFLDGTTMTLVGVSDPTKIKFVDREDGPSFG